jgi:hypothetical protein
MRQTLSSPAAIKAWAIVDYARDLHQREKSARQFMDSLMTSLQNLGEFIRFRFALY